MAARLFGAGLALALAFERSYDPTQVFVVVVASVVVLSLVATRGVAGDVSAAIGAGVVFFAGAVLLHFGNGLAMLAMGAFAGAASFALADRLGRPVVTPAVAFAGAVFLTGSLQALIVFSFE